MSPASLTAIFCLGALTISSLANAAPIAPETASPQSSPLAAAASTDSTGGYDREVKSGVDAYDLQIVARTFRPANSVGPTISLVGATHIGTAAFYKALQQFLDQQSLVLYEGVGGAKPMKKPEKTRDKSGLQNVMASALGLDFQLNDIDYTKPNFQNCDMTIAQMQQVIASRKTTDGDAKKTAQSLNNLVALMRGKTWLSYLLGGVFFLVEHSEKMQAIAKLTLVHGLSAFSPEELSGSASQKQLLELILQERNRHVMSEVGKILHSKNPPKTIAIFYGAAHLPGMEQTLRTQFGYVPSGEKWFTAFGADLKKAGFENDEAKTLDAMIRADLENLKKKATKATPAR